MSSLKCAGEERREAVRVHRQLNGFDYVEVGADQRVLTVHFLGKAPVALAPHNLTIEGGRRIRDVRVERVTIRRTAMAGLDDTMEVVTDRPGDASEYVLSAVERDEQGVTRPHTSFDRHYSRVTFSFKADCPGDLDCMQERVCPPERRDEPEINYLAKDYASFRQLMLDRLALVMPEWRERHVPDFGIAVVEALAYVGDHLSYYQDAVATEAYLGTARQRISVRRHARLVDYHLHEGCNARAWVCLQADGDVTLDPADVWFITHVPDLGPVVKRAGLEPVTSGQYEVFRPITRDEMAFHPGHHEIHLYTWGDSKCCLDLGATGATLIGQWIETAPPVEPPCDPPSGAPGKPDAPPAASAAVADAPRLHLSPGDVLIFEEVMGPKTGIAADADPAKRHPVLLTRVTHVADPLNPGQALTEIEWAEDDALPFPLCLSAMGPPPACEVIEHISVARGNLVLVDHGRPVVEDLDPVPVKAIVESCDCDGTVADTRTVAGRFRPVLKGSPLTFRQDMTAAVSAAGLLEQDARQALPEVVLTAAAKGASPATWLPRRDLLGSLNPDLHFAVEIDDERRAHLRFGDDEMGQRPEAGTLFTATYRVGSGRAGNVGAGALAHLVTGDHAIGGGIVSVRNPLPARGGREPEPKEEARLYALKAFRTRLERAVTAEDYAAIVQREFGSTVQRAAAVLRWNGSWHEVLVVVDVLGRQDADAALLTAIAQRLERYRRIGHDLRVAPARRVPLDIELRVCVLDGFLRAHVKQALLDVFGARMYGDGRLGFFHPDRLSFGEGIFLSRLVATAQAVAGVESVSVTRLKRLFEPANDEIGSGVLPLGPLEIARVDNDPSVPDNGQLQLDMRGGR